MRSASCDFPEERAGSEPRPSNPVAAEPATPPVDSAPSGRCREPVAELEALFRRGPRPRASSPTFGANGLPAPPDLAAREVDPTSREPTLVPELALVGREL